MRYTVIPEDIRKQIQMNAGVLLSNFDLTNPYTDPASADIIAVTSGGINPTCAAQTVDLFEDVDNAPNGTMEGFQITGYDCQMGFTSLSFNEENIAWALGASDKTTLSNGIRKIVPRVDVKTTDFKDVWWVTDMLDGGALAVCLRNAISTNGLNIQSTKNGKGTSAITLKGFITAKDQKKVPMEYYIIPPEGGETEGAIELNHHSVTLTEGDTVTLVASRYPADATVTWTSSDTTIATVDGGLVTAVAEGDAIITAQISVDSVEFTDTCTIIVNAEN
ncbi:MAG: Ig domain-containing protein [Ruminococcus sp.]|nr:Ig domain-containing protein [Ruminococcus sp.]